MGIDSSPYFSSVSFIMASGYGLNGGPSRCYGFWQEVLGCYVVNAGEGETGKKQCMPALEDYYECLHHRKEVRLCSPPLNFETKEGMNEWIGFGLCMETNIYTSL